MFTNTTACIDILDISIMGGFVPMTFGSEYTHIMSTGNAAYGSYRNFKWYKDSGETAIFTVNSANYLMFDTSLGAGTYDVIARLKGEPSSGERFVVGAVADNTATEAYNAYNVGPAETADYNVWYSGQLTVSADGMTLIGANLTNTGTEIEMYVKEAS